MLKKILSPIYQSVIVILCVLTLSQNAHATTGGDDDFEILGIDQREQKVFFSIIDGDASGYEDEVFYIRLNKSPKPIFAKSLYRTGNIEDCYEDVCRDAFQKKIKRITKRLTPLIPTTTNNLTWRIIKQTTQSIPWYSDPDYPTPEHDTHYQVVMNNGKKMLKGNGHVVYYRDQFSIHQAYAIPKRPEILVVIEYLGKPYEFGYKKYDVILLTAQ